MILLLSLTMNTLTTFSNNKIVYTKDALVLLSIVIDRNLKTSIFWELPFILSFFIFLSRSSILKLCTWSHLPLFSLFVDFLIFWKSIELYETLHRPFYTIKKCKWKDHSTPDKKCMWSLEFFFNAVRCHFLRNIQTPNFSFQLNFFDIA